MNSIQAAATQCPGFRRVVPRNRDDESHVEAIERELIKLGSEVCVCTVGRRLKLKWVCREWVKKCMNAWEG